MNKKFYHLLVGSTDLKTFKERLDKAIDGIPPDATIETTNYQIPLFWIRDRKALIQC